MRLAPLAEIATPETDSELASASVHWSVKQVRELATSHRGTTDANAARQFENRSLRFNDAKATIWAAFTQDDYAVAKAAMIARVSWSGSASSSSSAGSAGGQPVQPVQRVRAVRRVQALMAERTSAMKTHWGM